LEGFILGHVVNVPKSSTTFRGILIFMFSIALENYKY